MESNFVVLKNGTLLNPFFLKETKEKEEMTFPEFTKSIGLRGISKRNVDGVGHIVYKIVDPEKWFLAKIKYGI